MEFKQRDEERYKEYLADVEIARRELVNMKLFPEQGILCDLYAITSHNHQVYYAIIYANDDKLNMAYAKTEIYTKQFVEPIKMYPFKDVKATEMDPNAEGRIIMGIKSISPKFAAKIYNVVTNMPDEHILAENMICIDGVFQAIRVFEESSVVKQIIYRVAD